MTFRYAVSLAPRLVQVAQAEWVRYFQNSPKVVSALGEQIYQHPEASKIRGVCQVWHGTTLDRIPRDSKLLKAIPCGPKSMPFLPDGVDFPYGANITACLTTRNQEDYVLVHIVADGEPQFSRVLDIHMLPKDTSVVVKAVYLLSKEWLDRGRV